MEAITTNIAWEAITVESSWNVIVAIVRDLVVVRSWLRRKRETKEAPTKEPHMPQMKDGLPVWGIAINPW